MLVMCRPDDCNQKSKNNSQNNRKGCNQQCIPQPAQQIQITVALYKILLKFCNKITHCLSSETNYLFLTTIT